MELHPENVVSLQYRDEIAAVAAQRGPLRPRRRRGIGMREVEVVIRRNAFQQARVPRSIQLIPPHVRQLDRIRELRNLTLQHAESGELRSFFAGGVERLQS